MKKVLFIFVLCLLCSFSSICFAYPNEKNGFRNFYWGESLQEVQVSNEVYDLKYKSYDKGFNSVYYVGTLKNPYVSGHLVNNINFIFWNNKLYSIYITFAEEKYSSILDSMKISFGYPRVENDKYYWDGEQTSMILGRQKGQFGMIFMANPYLSDEARKGGAIKGW